MKKRYVYESFHIITTSKNKKNVKVNKMFLMLTILLIESYLEFLSTLDPSRLLHLDGQMPMRFQDNFDEKCTGKKDSACMAGCQAT